jgi:electron transfer flavoprotein beta subunit
MPELRTVVCVKVVPKSEEIRVDKETMLIVREDVRSEINPPDMNALEMAIDLKNRHGGRVDILSMGPPSFEPFLRVGLAMGADHIYLLSDRELGGADTLATTYTLAQGIRKIGGADLIFCGEESADGATGQVPAGLAEWLDVGQLTLLTQVEVDMALGISTGRREVKGGYEILEVPLPCVVSVKTACNEPRFMDFQRKPWAFESEGTLTLWNASDLGADPDYIGLTGSPTIVSRLAEAPTRQRRREFLDGSPEEIAGQLAVILTKAL